MADQTQETRAGPTLPVPWWPHPWREDSCDHPLSSLEREGQSLGLPQSAGLKTLWLGVGRRAASLKPLFQDAHGLSRPLGNEPVRLGSSRADCGVEAAQRLLCGSWSCPAVPRALHWVPSPLLVPHGAVGVLSLLSQGWRVISIKMTPWQMDRASVHSSSGKGSRGCHLTSWWQQKTWLRAQHCSAWGRAFRGHREVQRLA